MKLHRNKAIPSAQAASTLLRRAGKATVVRLALCGVIPPRLATLVIRIFGWRNA